MEIIDLLTTSEKDVRWLTNKHCGGKFGFWQRMQKGGTGFGGLYYIGGIEQIDANLRALDPLRANMEVYRQGYGIYLRNGQESHLVLLQPRDLLDLRLLKALPRSTNDPSPFQLFLQLQSGEIAGFEFIKFAEKRISAAVRRVFGTLLKQ